MSSQKIAWHDKKWTKWSNFTLNQQKTTTINNLMAITSNKLRKCKTKTVNIKKQLKNQLVTKINNKINTSQNHKKQQVNITF
ncbi:hypothetical protein ED033_19260 [Salmonella enterica]|uniref:Uncharacterized protein n=1 Tax=Salmonella enterica TaxID=28901 RepID=A0A3I8FSR4_SALER|nr:hypothetical protein [Salmonella enterica]